MTWDCPLEWARCLLHDELSRCRLEHSRPPATPPSRSKPHFLPPSLRGADMSEEHPPPSHLKLPGELQEAGVFSRRTTLFQSQLAKSRRIHYLPKYFNDLVNPPPTWTTYKLLHLDNTFWEISDYKQNEGGGVFTLIRDGISKINVDNHISNYIVHTI